MARQKPKFDTRMECYLWDLLDEGIDDVLDRLKGEAGVTGITVPVHCPPIDHLRAHADVTPRTFRSKGGAQFQPDARLYSGTRMRPVVAEWLRKSNPLRQVADACAARDLTLRAWVIGVHNPAVVERYPICAAKDVFGEPIPDYLCPVNPDVREYLRALVEDLHESYGIAELLIGGIQFPALTEEDFTQAIGPTEVDRWLLSTCFCESCRQLAQRDGLDVDRAARTAFDRLEEVLATGQAQEDDLDFFLDAHPAIEAYAQWQADQLPPLAEAIRSSFPGEVILDGYHGFEDQEDVSALTVHCDRLHVPCNSLDTEEIESAVSFGVDLMQEPHRVELAMLGTGAVIDPEDLVSAMAKAAEEGVRCVTIENYGILPLACLEAVHRGVRFAGRLVD